MNEIDILPSYINNTNFKYLELDEKYIASIVILDYPRKISFIELTDSIPKSLNYDMSIFIQKQDTTDVLKKLTYCISSSGGEIKTVNENQVDIDILSKLKNDAKDLRKDIQINNEQVFHISIIITFYSKEKEKIFKILKDFQNKIFSKQLMSNVLNFRHLDAYLLNLPLNQKNKIIVNKYRNITTSTLANIFPFYTKTIFDPYGIIFGYTIQENKLCNIDIFSNSYLNANICIFGSSGSGKSYFTKLLILRHFLNGKQQYLFDPEGEYKLFIKNLNCEYISIGKQDEKYINILDIKDEDILVNDFLDEKLERVTSFILKLLNIDNVKEYNEIKKAINSSYEKFGIDKNINSLYMKNTKNNMFVNNILKFGRNLPCLYDVLKEIKNKKLYSLFEKNILNKFPNISNYTNIDLNNKLIAFDTSSLNTNIATIFVDYIIESIQLKFKLSNRVKTIIYIDEIWKYIHCIEKNNLLEKIFTLFKTIRKNKGSIVTITQDISDFFAIDNGSYGKSILNNCGFKIFFKLDFSDTEILQKLSVLDNETLSKILILNKGQAVLGFKNNITVVNVKSSEYEMKLIEEDKNEDSSGIRK